MTDLRVGKRAQVEGMSCIRSWTNDCSSPTATVAPYQACSLASSARYGIVRLYFFLSRITSRVTACPRATQNFPSAEPIILSFRLSFSWSASRVSRRRSSLLLGLDAYSFLVPVGPPRGWRCSGSERSMVSRSSGSGRLSRSAQPMISSLFLSYAYHGPISDQNCCCSRQEFAEKSNSNLTRIRYHFVGAFRRHLRSRSSFDVDSTPRHLTRP